ncbi:MAG: hypothetical protein HY000_08565 [Planctomycetes bacterium]|nr:hypothetical protein [Planctomycetota bacterium]
MTLAAEKELQHIGESRGCADHDHDLVHELGKRLDALWRYDQYIANADGHSTLQSFWRELKSQEYENVKRLKELIKQEIENDCF